MAHLHRTVVTLRIGGDDLVPAEISGLLGVAPTHAQIKGEQIIGRKTGRVRIAKSGLWRLCAADREPEDMDGQVQELLNQMTSVSERSKPASRERMKTSHFEERIALGAAHAAQRRDESTQRELATFDNDLGGAWVVPPADCA